jgi:hypothetical protein
MKGVATGHRPGRLSFAMIAASITASAAVALAMDVVLVRYATDLSVRVLLGAAIFNGTGIMQSVVGGIIEWRRPGNAIGRLMMLAGPLYAIVTAGWTIGSTLESLVDPEVYRVFSWTVTLLSWPAVALIAGWIPILFPTGALPGPRWRVPAGVLLSLTSIGLVAMSLRPGPPGFEGVDLINPFGFEAWPGFLQPFVDAVPFAVLGTVLLAMVAVISRYRRGDRFVRLQIRWFVAAVAIVPVSLLGILLELGLRAAGAFDGQAEAPNGLAFALVTDAGIFAMPIAIGIAVTRYRLYEIDRLISRTIGWALVTGVLVAVFGGTVIGLQAVLDRVMQGETLAVAASTLIAFALFQPVRQRVQTAVDHRFDRARYDGDRTAAAFAERLREQVDLAGLEADIAGVVDGALRPTSVGLWIRRPEHRGARL